MAKRKISLSEDQRENNELILARIESEKARLFEETRALQQQFRRNIKRKRAKGHSLSGFEEAGQRSSPAYDLD
jgi:hypothetical protein